MKSIKPFVMLQHQSQKQSAIRNLSLKELDMISGAGSTDLPPTGGVTFCTGVVMDHEKDSFN